MATDADVKEVIRLLTSIDKKLSGTSAGGTGAGGGTTSGAADKKITRAMVLAAVQAVKAKLGPAASKKLVNETGGARAFDAVDPKKWPAMMAEAERLLPGEDEEAAGEAEAEDDGL